MRPHQIDKIDRLERAIAALRESKIPPIDSAVADLLEFKVSTIRAHAQPTRDRILDSPLTDLHLRLAEAVLDFGGVA